METSIAAKLEQFSIEFRKNKTKVITLANHNGQWYNQNSKQVNVADVTRTKTYTSVTIAVGFTYDWLREWREFFKPIIKRGKSKPKQTRIAFAISGENRFTFFLLWLV